MLIVFSLCWGSFLNMLSYRLINNASFGGRSYCVHCKKTIAGYDLIPVISWIILKGSCRSCHQAISPLYPFIELLTTVIFTCLYFYLPTHYFLGYGIFFSALIITIRSDLEYMLISRLVTLFLVPLGIALSAANLLPISALESILGACVGYGFLWLVSKIFTFCTHKQGIGEGDFDLLCFIGAFTGIIGCWASVLIGSIAGSIIGLYYCATTRNAYSIKIPFGPFLALGAILFVFLQAPITHYLLGTPCF